MWYSGCLPGLPAAVGGRLGALQHTRPVLWHPKWPLAVVQSPCLTGLAPLLMKHPVAQAQFPGEPSQPPGGHLAFYHRGVIIGFDIKRAFCDWCQSFCDWCGAFISAGLLFWRAGKQTPQGLTLSDACAGVRRSCACIPLCSTDRFTKWTRVGMELLQPFFLVSRGVFDCAWPSNGFAC